MDMDMDDMDMDLLRNGSDMPLPLPIGDLPLRLPVLHQLLPFMIIVIIECRPLQFRAKSSLMRRVQRALPKKPSARH